MAIQNFTIEKSNSSIGWVGRKVTGSHNGTIDIKDGILTVTNGRLSGGQVAIDISTIKISDVTDPSVNAQFAAHLASDDFFNTASFPVATLAINSVSQENGSDHHIAGDLTIKGITHPIEFDAKIDDIGAQTLKASGRITIDLTLYGMRFRSGNFFRDLGDTLIYNDFTLDINISAKVS